MWGLVYDLLACQWKRKGHTWILLLCVFDISPLVTVSSATRGIIVFCALISLFTEWQKKLKTTLSLLLCLVLLWLCYNNRISLFIYFWPFYLRLFLIQLYWMQDSNCQTHLCTHSLIGKHISCYTKRIIKWCYNTLAHHEAKNQFRSV